MKILTRLKSFYNVITSSIAFYPTFSAITAILVALSLKFAEEAGITKFVKEHAAVLVINDVDTARNLLTTLIAGGISMLVFSFSMVMLLLSQAASNYSPRVLPNLISERKHQIILGTFLSTILFNVITIVGIDPQGNDYQLPGFSVLMGILSSLVAVIAFIYFIHSISTSIQINNILRNIFTLSRKRLQRIIEEQNEHIDFADTTNWHEYKTEVSGTIQNISTTSLINFLNKQDNKMTVEIIKGSYLRKNDILFKTENKLNDQEIEEVYKGFNYSSTELVSDNYILGLKQITEIGVKAMSPGINDPGTALDTINHITDLLSLRMQKNDVTIICDDDNRPILKINSLPFDNLCYFVLAPYRNYCKHDFVVMFKIFDMFLYLLNSKSINGEFYTTIKNQSQLAFEDVQSSINNTSDLEKLKLIHEKIQQF